MKLYGIDEQQAQCIAAALDLELDNLRRVSKNAIAMRVIPHSARSKYARTSASGRRLKATCYHGFRDFITAAFEEGATRVQSTGGDFKSLEQFDYALPRLARLNIGSEACPRRMLDACEC
jgi:hypothetical protein